MILHGITVQLEQKTETGIDEFNRPTYTSEFVTVDNVLVGKPDAQDVIDTLNLTGRKIDYILGIPKGDEHDWRNKKVVFFGMTFRTVGIPETGIQDLIPMDWGQNIRVERYE